MPRQARVPRNVTSEFGATILGAVDPGGGWESVVGHAAARAARHGARLHLVHVFEKPPAFLRLTMSSGDLRAWESKARRDAEERLESIRAGLARSERLDVTISIRSGRAAAEIMAEARKVRAGLIVCGAGVTEGTEWLYMGTTPDRILRTSAVPVLVVRTGAVKPFKRVLVPADLDRADEGALRVGSRLAEEAGGRVTVLHVYEQASLQARMQGDLARLRSDLRAAARSAFHAFVDDTALPPRAKPPRKLLVASLDRVRPAETIVGEAARLRSDLIVMALGSATVLRRLLLGSVAERVIRLLPCSLLALPKAWAERW